MGTAPGTGASRRRWQQLGQGPGPRHPRDPGSHGGPEDEGEFGVTKDMWDSMYS